MTTTTPPATLARPELAEVARAIAKRSFCTLATASTAGRPHAAGVIYAAVDDELWDQHASFEP